MDGNTSAVEACIAHLEGGFEQLDHRLGSLEADLRSGFIELHARIDRMDQRIDRLTWRMTALIVGSWVTILTTVITLAFTGPHH